MTDVITEAAGATVAMAVHKEGPASYLVGHNLVLRCCKFILQPAFSVPTLGQLRNGEDSGGRGIKRSDEDALLAQCCYAVSSAKFTPGSITVQGAFGKQFVTSVTATRDDAANGRTFPALFRWPAWEMSDGDVAQIRDNIFGFHGVLGNRAYQCSKSIEFEFSRPCDSAEHVVDHEQLHKAPYTISGKLNIHGRACQIFCTAFLTKGNPLMMMKAAQLKRDKSQQHHVDEQQLKEVDTVVFQCPLKSSRWHIETASVFGLLRTNDEVLVEVATPVSALLDRYN